MNELLSIENPSLALKLDFQVVVGGTTTLVLVIVDVVVEVVDGVVVEVVVGVVVEVVVEEVEDVLVGIVCVVVVLGIIVVLLDVVVGRRLVSPVELVEFPAEQEVLVDGVLEVKGVGHVVVVGRQNSRRGFNVCR